MSSADRASCGSCSPGTYVKNQESCESCESGKYAPVALTDSCLDCTAGFSTGADSGAEVCVACNGGEFSEGLAVTCEWKGVWGWGRGERNAPSGGGLVSRWHLHNTPPNHLHRLDLRCGQLQWEYGVQVHKM